MKETKKDTLYRVRFDAKSDISGNLIAVAAQEDGVDGDLDGNIYTQYIRKNFILTDKFVNYDMYFKPTSTLTNTKTNFQLGYLPTGSSLFLRDTILTEFYPKNGTNLLLNGDFSQDMDHWHIYEDSTVSDTTCTVEDNVLIVQVNIPGYPIQNGFGPSLYQNIGSLKENTYYSIQFTVWSEPITHVAVELQNANALTDSSSRNTLRRLTTNSVLSEGTETTFTSFFFIDSAEDENILEIRFYIEDSALQEYRIKNVILNECESR